MERPTKKPRPHGPDGFQKAKQTSRYKPPESVTKFVSSFDSPVKPTAAPKSLLGKKPGSVTAHDRPQTPFVGLAVPPQPEAGPSRPSMVKRKSKSVSPVRAPRVAETDKALPVLKVLKPPVLLPLPAAAASKTTRVEPSAKTASATPSSLQPKFKLPSAPSEKPMSILKPPPLPIPPFNKLPVELKPLVPPPFPEQRPTSPKKPVKTILTTNIALATDPTKEGAGAELLSLFLQQHGHGFVSSMDRELQRGVMVSPDKRSRGKDFKFIRGGLAERFQHRISCTKTDFVLWRRQMEQKIESGAKFRSDMQLRIMRVLDMAKVSERSRSTAGARTGLALCRLMRRHPMTSGDLTLGTYVVVFSFGQTDGGRSAVSSADLFKEGNDVMAWLPWHKVELVCAEGCAGLLEMFRALDALTPPHSLLVVSRFYIVAPGPPRQRDLVS